MQTLKSLDEDLVVWKRIPNHPDYEVSSNLAKKYGVNQSTISRVKSGSTWRDANPFVSA